MDGAGKSLSLRAARDILKLTNNSGTSQGSGSAGRAFASRAGSPAVHLQLCTRAQAPFRHSSTEEAVRELGIGGQSEIHEALSQKQTKS